MTKLNKSISPIADLEEFYILGLPIETIIGDCHHLLVRDYPILQSDLKIFSLTKQHFLNALSKENNDKEMLKEVEKMELVQIVLSFEDIRESYERVFDYFFQKKNALAEVGDVNQFNYLRGLILRLSCIQEEKINPNPEIQEAIERSRRIKAQESGKLEFSDIITSVSAYTGKNYREISEMTLYQLYMEFYRVVQLINYQTSTLFATVAEKVEIDDWKKHIKMFEEEKHYITQGQFNKDIKQKIED